MLSRAVPMAMPIATPIAMPAPGRMAVATSPSAIWRPFVRCPSTLLRSWAAFSGECEIPPLRQGLAVPACHVSVSSRTVSVDRRPRAPAVRRSRSRASRRSIARANRSLGVIVHAGSSSGGAAGLARRCLVGSGRATRINVWPSRSTGPPHWGHRRMSLSPIPASRSIGLHAAAKAGRRFSHVLRRCIGGWS
jgi:hypothetical protein